MILNWIAIFSLSFGLSIIYCSEALAEKTLPSYFSNEDSAKNNKCEMVFLKSTTYKSCIVKTFDDHEMILTVYDDDKNGRYIKADTLKITSWYHEAEVRYEKILNDGLDSIIVEFEGNTGTGVIQHVLAVFAWRNGFLPTLIESLSYHNEHPSNIIDLSVKYKFDKMGTNDVALEIDYEYVDELRIDDSGENTDKHEEVSSDKSIKYVWHDKLVWNPDNYSFYGSTRSRSSAANSNPIRQRITNSRDKVSKGILFLRNGISLDVLHEIDIMEIVQ